MVALSTTLLLWVTHVTATTIYAGEWLQWSSTDSALGYTRCCDPALAANDRLAECRAQGAPMPGNGGSTNGIEAMRYWMAQSPLPMSLRVSADRFFTGLATWPQYPTFCQCSPDRFGAYCQFISPLGQQCVSSSTLVSSGSLNAPLVDLYGRRHHTVYADALAPYNHWQYAAFGDNTVQTMVLNDNWNQVSLTETNTLSFTPTTLTFASNGQLLLPDGRVTEIVEVGDSKQQIAQVPGGTADVAVLIHQPIVMNNEDRFPAVLGFQRTDTNERSVLRFQRGSDVYRCWFQRASSDSTHYDLRCSINMGASAVALYVDTPTGADGAAVRVYWSTAQQKLQNADRQNVDSVLVYSEGSALHWRFALPDTEANCVPSSLLSSSAACGLNARSVQLIECQCERIAAATNSPVLTSVKFMNPAFVTDNFLWTQNPIDVDLTQNSTLPTLHSPMFYADWNNITRQAYLDFASGTWMTRANRSDAAWRPRALLPAMVLVPNPASTVPPLLPLAAAVGVYGSNGFILISAAHVYSHTSLYDASTRRCFEHGYRCALPQVNQRCPDMSSAEWLDVGTAAPVHIRRNVVVPSAELPYAWFRGQLFAALEAVTGKDVMLWVDSQSQTLRTMRRGDLGPVHSDAVLVHATSGFGQLRQFPSMPPTAFDWTNAADQPRWRWLRWNQTTQGLQTLPFKDPVTNSTDEPSAPWQCTSIAGCECAPSYTGPFCDIFVVDECSADPIGTCGRYATCVVSPSEDISLGFGDIKPCQNSDRCIVKSRCECNPGQYGPGCSLSCPQSLYGGTCSGHGTCVAASCTKQDILSLPWYEVDSVQAFVDGPKYMRRGPAPWYSDLYLADTGRSVSPLTGDPVELYGNSAVWNVSVQAPSAPTQLLYWKVHNSRTLSTAPPSWWATNPCPWFGGYGEFATQGPQLTYLLPLPARYSCGRVVALPYNSTKFWIANGRILYGTASVPERCFEPVPAVQSGADSWCECSEGYGGLNCQLYLQNLLQAPNTTTMCSGNGRPVRNQVRDDVVFSVPSCQCDNGFTGPFCEISLCANQTCGAEAGRGVCRMLPEAGPTCQCNPPWGGLYCELNLTDANSCSDSPTSLPCSGNGLCTPLGRCLCNTGYQGTYCQTSSCSTWCGPGGKCIGGSCQCGPMFSGPQCNQLLCDTRFGRLDNATQTVCVCNNPDLRSGPYCNITRCPSDPVTGQVCGVPADQMRCNAASQCECLDNRFQVSLALGTCTPRCSLVGGQWDEQSQSCQCFGGYSGPQCANTLCQNGGSWDTAALACACAFGWGGPHCEVNLCVQWNPHRGEDNSLPDPARRRCVCGGSADGVCASGPVNDTRALCFPGELNGYNTTGCNCTFPWRCDEQPCFDCSKQHLCLNGGSPALFDDGWRCECPYPFTGQRCEAVVCPAPAERFNVSDRCSCVFPWTGAPSCTEHQCINGDPVRSPDNSTSRPFQCRCYGAEFYGERCELRTDVDASRVTPLCQPYGVWNLTAKRCQCISQQFDPDQNCAALLCQNGAKWNPLTRACEGCDFPHWGAACDLEWCQGRGPGATGQVIEGNQCQCFPGWRGPLCQCTDFRTWNQSLQLCVADCVYGQPSADGQRCECLVGWIGPRCSIPEPLRDFGLQVRQLIANLTASALGDGIDVPTNADRPSAAPTPDVAQYAVITIASGIITVLVWRLIANNCLN